MNDREKTIAAKVWNRENAKIEVVRIDNMQHIKAKFEEKSENMWIRIQREIWDWGEDSDAVKRDRAIMEHYRALRPGLTERQLERFTDLILDSKFTRKDITRYTVSLGPAIRKVYGWA